MLYLAFRDFSEFHIYENCYIIEIKNCFSDEPRNLFADIWRFKSEIPVKMTYQDIGGFSFVQFAEIIVQDRNTPAWKWVNTSQSSLLKLQTQSKFTSKELEDLKIKIAQILIDSEK